jgi:hypothetical protein
MNLLASICKRDTTLVHIDYIICFTNYTMDPDYIGQDKKLQVAHLDKCYRQTWKTILDPGSMFKKKGWYGTPMTISVIFSYLVCFKQKS